jgi:GTP diphosphokinase / guanosine-3',5'-bis(diphosphate) 3'-diphosphatase
MTFAESELESLLKAVRFSSDKHRAQRRKGADEIPYVNHPIEVAELLWRVGGVRNVPVLVAAILHDTLEDTDATSAELEREFGREVCALVEEVTDDKSLPKDVRKRLQIEHAAHKSEGAKLVKLGDKICNIRDVAFSPPSNWALERRRAYLDWSERVVDGLRGTNGSLEAYYDEVLERAREAVGSAE